MTLQDTTERWHDQMVRQLADAMEKGYELCPRQVSGNYIMRINGIIGCCAVGMIAVGLHGQKPDINTFLESDYSMGAVCAMVEQKVEPNHTLWDMKVEMPLPHWDDSALSSTLFTLNDTINWSIPQIVAWLRSLRWNAQTHLMEITIKEDTHLTT